MSEPDLEKGTANPSPAQAAANHGVEMQNQDWSPRPNIETLPDYPNGQWKTSEEAADSILGVPRPTVERLLKSWADIIEQDLGHRAYRARNLDQVQIKHEAYTEESNYKPSSFPNHISPNADGSLHFREGIKEPNNLDGGQKKEQIQGFGQQVSMRYETRVGSYRDRVEVMSWQDIEADNTVRRNVRKRWRRSSDLEHLEDTWKHLWKSKPEVAYGVFQWSCSDDQRKALQWDLIDALNSGRPPIFVDMHMRRDHRAVASWISLIGIRLNDLYRMSQYCNDVAERAAPLSPVVQIRVLIECIWACNESSDTDIGQVLKKCYRRRVLRQPNFHEGAQLRRPIYILLSHYRSVRLSIYLVSTLFRHEIPKFTFAENLETTWSTPISVAEMALRKEPDVISPTAGREPFFSVDDFNLRDLQNLGHLQIQWTSYWDEHLELQTSQAANILKLYWFQPSFSNYFCATGLCGDLDEEHRQQREQEIYQTWCLIFTSSTSEKESHRFYERLRAPRWLSLLGHSQLGTWNVEQEINEAAESSPPLFRFWRRTESDSRSWFCFETRDHILLRWSKNRKMPHEKIAYSRFPIYEHRLRELRYYMDSQQPKGLKALWRDRRNSNTYYTFWFVVIFGFASIFIAFSSLVVSITQTWAQFRSINSSG